MDQRDEVEAKLAWLEKYVGELDGVVRGLADEVIALRAEVTELRAARTAGREGQETIDGGYDLGYEKPPHY